MKKIIGVIFDMDGTLLDTQKIFIPAWEYAGNLQGIKGAGECVKNVCGMNEEGWTNYIKNKYKTMDVEAFKKNVNKYVAENLQLRFKKGAPELIDFLKKNNIKIAVASGTEKETIVKHLIKLNSLDKFDVIVGGEEVVNGKPAPDIFLLTCEKLGLSPEECIIFEDSANGVRAAQNAGVKCIGIPDVAEFNSEIKKMLYAELPGFLEAIEIFDGNFLN